MIGRRRTMGDETWNRLHFWSRGSKAAERLAALILHGEGYHEIDPSHPLGGPDGTKDIMCTRKGRRFVVAVHFPNGPVSFLSTRKKFKDDSAGISANEAAGMVFVTNQKITVAQRVTLKKLAPKHLVEIFNVDRLATILDRPPNYGTRADYLDIAVTLDEAVAQLSLVIAEKMPTYERLKREIVEDVVAAIGRPANPRSRRKHG